MHLLIRADANVQIGSGHIMRCLALGQAWQDQGGHVTFLCHADLPPKLHDRLLDEDMAVTLIDVSLGSQADAEQTINNAAHAQAVVVDGYHFGADYQKWLKTADLRVLFIDDNGHADHYYADWVLNQNIHADESLYKHREPYTQLLLGTSYALLRREFWQWRGQDKVISDQVRHVMVTMGGSDPDNVTHQVLQAIAALPDAHRLHVKVVVGGANPHLAMLQAFADSAKSRVDILHNVHNMPEIMAWADLAVSAGGSTVWELCLMGVPAVLVTTAQNQESIAAGLHIAGASIYLGRAGEVTLDHTSETLTNLFRSSKQVTSLHVQCMRIVNQQSYQILKIFILQELQAS